MNEFAESSEEKMTAIPSKEQKKLPTWTVAVAAVGLLALLGFLCFITTLSADDYWYSTFFYDGLPGYFRLLVEHYQTFNGRTFVHMCVQIVLFAGNWLFATCGVVLMALIPLLAAKACCPTAKWWSGKPLFSLVIFAALLLALPTAMLVEGVLWISAFFSFAMTTTMLVFAIYLLQKTRNTPLGVGSHLLLCLYFFLCGATTEQSGVTAAVIALLFCGELAVREKKLNLWNLGQVAAAVLGLATILLSPATQNRIGSEVGTHSGDLFARLASGLTAESRYFVGGHFLFFCFVLFFLLFGLFWWAETGRKAVPAVCVALTGLILVLYALNIENFLIFALMLCGIALCGGLLIVTGRYPALGYLLYAALLSVGSVVFTNSIIGRTMLPCALLVLACMASMLMLLADRYPVGQAPLLLAAVALAAVAIVPDIPGYWSNHLIEVKNLAYIQEAPQTGVLYTRIDYDKRYTHAKMDEYPGKFAEYAKVDPQTTKIYYYTQDGLVVYLNGQRMTYPAFLNDGQWCLALRSLIESSGGQVLWSRQETTVLYNGRTSSIRDGMIYYTDQAGVPQSLVLPTCPQLFMTLPVSLFEQVFGMQADIRAEDQALYLTDGR